MQKSQARSYAANYIINLNESLKFLAFSIEREKFNPDKRFTQEPQDKNKIKKLTNNKFQIFWKQNKDFWIDERLQYIANIKNNCTR